jgi:hypothetical protein
VARPSRHLRAALAAATLILGSAVVPARAQQIPVGTGGSVTSLISVPVDVPLVVDMSARAERLGSITLRLSWDAAVLRFDGGTDGNFGQLVVNQDSALQGVLRVAGVNPVGASGRVVIGVARFTPLATDTTDFLITVVDIAAAGTFASLLPAVVVQSSQYCPGLGRFGDAVNNGTINGQDALGVLSYAVGLAPAGVDVPLGDVDADGVTDTRDALIILSFAVGLDVSGFRINELAAGGCVIPAPVSFAIAPGATGSLEIGQELSLRAVGTGAGGTVIPVNAVVWETSNAGVATVSATGFVDALAAGTAVIRAIRDGRDTASLSLTVVAGRTLHVVDARAADGIGTAELPFASLQSALAVLTAGDTVRLRPGRYEGLQLPVAVTVIGDLAGDTMPVLVPGSFAGAVMILGSGRYQFRRVAFAGSANRMLDLGIADTVELDSVSISVDVARCADAAIAGSDVFLLALRSVRLVGDGYTNGCADGVRLYGNTRQLEVEDAVITDFAGSGIYVYNLDSGTVRRAVITGNGGYALWTQAWQGYGVGRVTAATNTALVLDSVRFTGEYSYGLLSAEDVRSARIARSRFIGGGYGQSLYLGGWYDGGSTRGYVELRNDSITARDANWIYAYGLDSLVLDSLRADGVGDSYLSDIGRVRVQRSTFNMTDYSGAALYLYGQRTALLLDSVDVRGEGCSCSTAVYAYDAASLDIRRLYATDLDEAIYHYSDSGLTVTDMIAERVDQAIYGYNYAATPPRVVIRRLTVLNSEDGVTMSNVAAVIDSSTFTLGDEAIELYGTGVDTLRALVITDYDEPIRTESSGLIENNQLVRPGDEAIYVYRYSDPSPLDTTVIRNNTITCAQQQQYATAIELSYATAVVEQNTVVNGCYRGIDAYSDNTQRVLTIRGNTVPMQPGVYDPAIAVRGNYRSEIVGNLIEGTATLPVAAGGIEVGYLYDRTAWARVDSNTVRFPQLFGIRLWTVDSALVRGNLVEDFRGGSCCQVGAIAVYSNYYSDTSQARIVGNTLRRTLGAGISAEMGPADTVWADSNAISQSDTFGIRISNGTAMLRGNNIRNNRHGVDLAGEYGVVHQVHGNAFQGNLRFGLTVAVDSADATANWWGNDSLPNRPGGDSVSGRLDVSAPLTAQPVVPPLAPRFAPAIARARPAGVVAPAPARAARPAPTASRRTDGAPPTRVVRRSGGGSLVLAPPSGVATRAAQRARADSIRAAAEAARAARQAELETARRRSGQ